MQVTPIEMDNQEEVETTARAKGTFPDPITVRSTQKIMKKYLDIDKEY